MKIIDTNKNVMTEILWHEQHYMYTYESLNVIN